MDLMVDSPSPGHNGGGHNHLRSTTKETTKEKLDRQMAAEVMAELAQSVPDYKPKYVTDPISSISSNSSSNGTSGSRSSKLISTPTTTDSITATTTTDKSKTNNVNIISPLPNPSTVTSHTTPNPSILPTKNEDLKHVRMIQSLTRIPYGNPLSLKNEKHHWHTIKHEQKARTLCTRTDNCLIVPPKSKHVHNTRKILDNSGRVPVAPLSKISVVRKIEKSHESPSHNKNNDRSDNVSIKINNPPTHNNKTHRKKSLPLLNARILKELLGGTNNQDLVYLIHPSSNDNFLVRSLNKKDFINFFLKVKQRLSGDSVSCEVLESQTSTSENENPIWGIIKNNGTVDFSEPIQKHNRDLRDTNIPSEQGEDNKSSENNNSNKDLSNSVILNNITSELSSKLTSSLPLKKRKVADSLLIESGTHNTGLISSNPSRLLKSVSQFAAECVRERHVFIVSPSNVPSFVKTVSANPFHDCTNQQLTKNFEIALHQDEDGDLPLHIAAVQKDLKMISLYGMLIHRAGKSVDRFNKKHLTPLHFCVKVKFLMGIKKLIQMGADVNTLDGNGQSALHIAVSNSDLECFDFMLQQCRIYVKDTKMAPNLNSHDYEGETLLHTAVNNNNIEMIDRLLQEEADLDAIDFKSGRTPMFYAVENNNIEIVKFLLEKKATVDIPNFAGNTAFLAANSRNYQDICNLLSDNGADTRGLMSTDESMPNPKTTAAVKSQLKNKLVSSKANQTLEVS